MCDQPQEPARNKPPHPKPVKITEAEPGEGLAGETSQENASGLPEDIPQRKGPADVAIWTRVPPPIGGMTIHVARLLPFLEAGNISTQLYCPIRPGPENPIVKQVSHRRIRWFLGMLFGRSEKLHYVLGDRALTRFGASLLAWLRRKKVIIVVGGRTLVTIGQQGSMIERWMTRFGVRHASAVIGVNPNICKTAIELGADPSRVHHIPAFIPPEDTGEKPPQAIQEFAAGKSKILLASGQVKAPGVEDVYGVGTILDTIAKLKEARPDVGLVFYAYEIVPLGPEPLRILAQEIKDRGLEEQILIHKSSDMMWPAIKLSDMMIRPTTTDGDSVAIRESLSMGVPVIASDCVPRPESVLTYPAGDTSALCDAINTVLDNLDQWRAKAASADMGRNAEDTVQLIKTLLED